MMTMINELRMTGLNSTVTNPFEVRLGTMAVWKKPDLTLPLLLIFLGSIFMILCLRRFTENGDGLPVVGRAFMLEPSFITRLRFAFKSRDILTDAYQKYNGTPYRLIRGDTNFVVLPSDYTTELNRLSQEVLNSRACHAFSLCGHLNGMNVVLHTDLHVRALLSTITPSLPRFTGPASQRIGESMNQILPQDSNRWTEVDLMNKFAIIGGQALALSVVGSPLCDNAEFMQLLNENTEDVFFLVFIMRLLPRILQYSVVWFLPAKWRLWWRHKRIEGIVATEFERQKTQPTNLAASDGSPLPSIFTCMKETKKENTLDSGVLTQLLTAISAGGTFSVANFIFAFILDILAHPHFLKDIREEIQQKNTQVDGEWNFNAFEELPRLDSALKETSRLAPGSLTTYSRVVMRDYKLSGGLTLRKGQFICVDSSSRAADDEVYPNAGHYDALRSYNGGLEDHLVQPFKGVYGTDFRWGAGRRACPGRYLASILMKIIIVKLLDEYDFEACHQGRKESFSMHEFSGIRPETKVKLRRRKVSLGIFGV
ncbi:cytochrome P450 [Penicillium malachiteum]|uniref:Cytochrome P450 n=1 Tax=Penicillium malachiteum TaxID=1324776 RepID=A0AAD6HLW4_9EURO|nr:cytochrome P450 [Penicillium malachiteum]